MDRRPPARNRQAYPNRRISGLFRWLLAAWIFAWGVVPASAHAAGPAPVTRAYLPALEKSRCPVQANAHRFGLQVYGATGEDSPYFPWVEDSGAQWLRVMLEWRAVEQHNVLPAQYRWDIADRFLQAASDSCIDVIAVVDHAPYWAAPTYRAPIYDHQLHEFVQFIQAVVERYDGDGYRDAPGRPVVKYWELYNEPDLAPSPGVEEGGGAWGPYGSQYAAMLKAVYPAIKAANPHAQVVFGGIAYDWFTDDQGIFTREFLDDVLKAGGGDSFDIMNFHFYPNNRANWTTGSSNGLVEKTAAVRAKLAEYGLAKPLVITEAGWHSNDNRTHPSSPDIQARYVLQFLTQAATLNIESLIWWMLYDDLEYPFESGLVSNIQRGPIAAKPAYAVYQEAVKRLGQAEFLAQLAATDTGDEDLEIYTFVDAEQRQFYVGWLNPIGQAISKPVRLPAQQVTVFDKAGAALKLVQDADDGDADGQVEVQIGSDPLYLLVQ